MKNLNEFEQFLSQINSIQKHYDEIAHIKGENFNIFNVLGMRSNETKLHSALLADLLNPKGSHGFETAFLKHFIDLISNEPSIAEHFKNEPFDTKSACVKIEVNAGEVDKDYTEGGRIDIVISNQLKQGIIIENKIYAIDQRNQLVRYKKYGDNNFKGGYILFYLNLDAAIPHINSSGDLIKNKDFHIISYNPTIIAWLEIIRKEASDHAILRETLKQYSILLNQLTNQSQNKAMENELLEVMKRNLEASFLISGSIDRLKNKILLDFADKLILHIESNNKEYSIRISKPEENLGQDRTFIVLENENKWRFELAVYFHGAYLPHIIIDKLNQGDLIVDDNIKEKVRRNIGDFNNLKFDKSINCIWNVRYDELLSGSNDATNWVSLLHEDQVDNLISYIDDILERIKDLDFLFKK